MMDDIDELLRRARPQEAPQPRKGIKWRRIGDVLRDRKVEQPPMLGTTARIVGQIP